MLRDNDTGKLSASNNMRLSTVIEYPREKVRASCVRIVPSLIDDWTISRTCVIIYP